MSIVWTYIHELVVNPIILRLNDLLKCIMMVCVRKALEMNGDVTEAGRRTNSRFVLASIGYTNDWTRCLIEFNLVVGVLEPRRVVRVAHVWQSFASRSPKPFSAQPV
jgi:hypothetical protein